MVPTTDTHQLSQHCHTNAELQRSNRQTTSCTPLLQGARTRAHAPAGGPNTESQGLSHSRTVSACLSAQTTSEILRRDGCLHTCRCASAVAVRWVRGLSQLRCGVCRLLGLSHGLRTNTPGSHVGCRGSSRSLRSPLRQPCYLSSRCAIPLPGMSGRVLSVGAGGACIRRAPQPKPRAQRDEV